MENIIKKELMKYYIFKEKLNNSTNKKDIVKLEIINMMIKRIKYLLNKSKYVNITKIINFEKILLNKNLEKNIDIIDPLYILKWLEYSKFLDRVSKEKVNNYC